MTADLIWREFTNYTLTDQRLSVETGMLARDKKTIPARFVQSVTIRQALAGRFMNYGTVIVQMSGSGARLSMIPDPHGWQQKVEELAAGVSSSGERRL